MARIPHYASTSLKRWRTQKRMACLQQTLRLDVKSTVAKSGWHYALTLTGLSLFCELNGSHTKPRFDVVATVGQRELDVAHTTLRLDVDKTIA